MGNVIPRQAPEVGGRDKRVVDGEGVGITRINASKDNTQPTTSKATAQSLSAVTRQDTNPSTALIRSAACVVVTVVQRRSAPISSLFLRARTAPMTVTPPSAVKRKRFSCVTRQASIVMSRMTRGVVVRLFGRWGNSRRSMIVGHRTTCLIHQP